MKDPHPLVGEGWGEGESMCPGLNCYPNLGYFVLGI
jgi:hypothetical protein